MSDALADLSARIGARRDLIQAAGGNTSQKTGDAMRIKASGLWLERAGEENVFVTVDLAGLRQAVRAGDTDEDYNRFSVGGSTLRPSIETPLHGMLPQTVGVHIHSVDAIAASARADREAFLAARLDGLSWRLVPYVKPGLPLTLAMLEAMGEGRADVFVFVNHGLMIGADDVAAASDLLDEVCDRLKLPVRACPPPDRERLEELSRGSGYAPAEATDIHAIATDPRRLAVARRGSLYPDHVVFLGPGLRVVEDGENLAEALARYERSGLPNPPALAVPSAGVLVRRDAGASVLAMLLCLSDVAGRLSPGDNPSVLSAEEERALMNWNAEAYRRALEQARA